MCLSPFVLVVILDCCFSGLFVVTFPSFCVSLSVMVVSLDFISHCDGGIARYGLSVIVMVVLHNLINLINKQKALHHPCSHTSSLLFTSITITSIISSLVFLELVNISFVLVVFLDLCLSLNCIWW